MNQVCSIFAQLLQLFPRQQFQRAVQQHRAERHARGFTCWGQFVAMMFCQLASARSLREICQGLAASEGKLRHLGVPTAPARSTLAYANEHRPWELYQTVFGELLSRCQAVAAGRKKFRFKNRLLSMDSTSIDLCASIYDWAKYKRTKGAAKVHLVLDNEGYLPVFACITDGKTHDVTAGRQMRLEAGTIVVMDKGYVDYAWWQQMTEAGVFFVTRLKQDLKSTILQENPVPENSNVRGDHWVEIQSTQRRRYRQVLRVVTIWDEAKEEEMAFLTNHFDFGPTTIARIYKERWQIELFFKALKQLLRVKTFVGTSANALKTQIWTALIAMLLVKYLQLKACFGWSLSNLVALLRQQLFVYRDLYLWLDHPLQAPPALAGVHDGQLALEF
ncbi:MAG TPA: IS4 family transposase [Anaerolineales bacterium]